MTKFIVAIWFVGWISLLLAMIWKTIQWIRQRRFVAALLLAFVTWSLIVELIIVPLLFRRHDQQQHASEAIAPP